MVCPDANDGIKFFAVHADDRGRQIFQPQLVAVGERHGSFDHPLQRA
jgi:hypothetical protein